MSKDNEFDPAMYGRVDLERYAAGAMFLQNFIPVAFPRPRPTFVMAIPAEVGEIYRMKIHVNRWGEECLFAEAVDGAVYLVDITTKTMTRAIAPAGLFD